jgi:hypothetical protein
MGIEHGYRIPQIEHLFTLNGDSAGQALRKGKV